MDCGDVRRGKLNPPQKQMLIPIYTVMVMVTDIMVDTMVMVLDTMDMDMDCGDARRGKLNLLLKLKRIPMSTTDTVMVMVTDTMVDTMVMVLDTTVVDGGENKLLLQAIFAIKGTPCCLIIETERLKY